MAYEVTESSLKKTITFLILNSYYLLCEVFAKAKTLSEQNIEQDGHDTTSGRNILS